MQRNIIMCAKKDNYFENIYWIENLIESCTTIEEDNKIRGLINELTNKLLKDNSVNPQVFDIMVNRLYSKHNDKFNTILHDFDFVQINSL